MVNKIIIIKNKYFYKNIIFKLQNKFNKKFNNFTLKTNFKLNKIII